MKKLLAAVLAVLMLASLFAGCASEKPAETTGANTGICGRWATKYGRPCSNNVRGRRTAVTRCS